MQFDAHAHNASATCVNVVFLVSDRSFVLGFCSWILFDLSMISGFVEWTYLVRECDAYGSGVGNKKLLQLPRARGGMSGQEQQERMHATERQ